MGGAAGRIVNQGEAAVQLSTACIDCSERPHPDDVTLDPALMTLWSQLDTVEGVSAFDPNLAGVTVDCDSPTLLWDVAQVAEDKLGVDVARMQRQCGGDESRPVPDMLLLPAANPEDLANLGRDFSILTNRTLHHPGELSDPTPEGFQFFDGDIVKSAPRRPLVNNALPSFDVDLDHPATSGPRPPAPAPRMPAPRTANGDLAPDGKRRGQPSNPEAKRQVVASFAA